MRRNPGTKENQGEGEGEGAKWEPRRRRRGKTPMVPYHFPLTGALKRIGALKKGLNKKDRKACHM